MASPLGHPRIRAGTARGSRGAARGGGPFQAALLALAVAVSAATPCALRAQAAAATPAADTPITIGQVEVTASKEQQLNSIDRKIYYVGRDIQATTGSAADVMQNIPSVEVDIDGNVSLRGNSSVQILIDGRSSAQMGSSSRADALAQMPADTIERIEVITNPSAKYKPDGTGGIINIVLKKGRAKGYSGSARVTVGNRRRYGLYAGGNLNPGPFNLYGSYSIRQDDRPRSVVDQRSYIDPTTHLAASTQSRTSEDSRPFTQLGRAGIEYKAGPKDVWREDMDFSYRTFDRHSLEHDTIANNLGVATTDYERYRYDPENEGDVDSTTSYEHDFSGQDETWTTELEFEHHAETERNHYTNTYAQPAGPPTTEFIRVAANEPSTELKSEYVDKVGDTSRLELGFDGTDDRSTQDHLDLVQDPQTGAMVSNPQVTNSFFMEQAVAALYATYRRSWGRFGMLAGGRFESVELKTDQITSAISDVQRYSSFYPSLHLSYDLTASQQLQLNYSHRVRRPESDDLNPYPRYQDPYNLSAGNPYLKPEETHSVEAGYQYKNGEATYLATLYYRASYDSFTQVSQYISSSTLLTTQENLGSSRSGGLEVAATASPTDKLSLNASGNLYYNQIDASNLGYDTRQSAIAWTGKASVEYALSKVSMFQVNTIFMAKRLTPQGYREPTFVANIGFKHEFKEKRLSLVLTVSDLFNSLKYVNKLDTPLLQDDVTRRRSARTVYMGLVYRFGAAKAKPKDDALQYDNQP